MIKKKLMKETPFQTAGPFIHIGCTPEIVGINNIFDQNVGNNPANNYGENQSVNITGQIFDGSSKPILDAMVEIRQYIFSENKNDQFLRIIPSFKTGRFTFNTFKPIYHEKSNGFLPNPHILFWIVARGMNQPLITKMFFHDSDLKNEKFIKKIKKKSRIKTLLAKKISRSKFLFNVYIQGDNETIFFDY